MTTKEFDPKTMQMANAEDVRKMWKRLWGDATVIYTIGNFEVEAGEYLDLTQRQPY